MRDRLSSIPLLLALLCAIILPLHALRAQEKPAFPRWEGALQLSDFIFNFFESPGSYNMWGITARLGYRPALADGRALIELRYAHAPRYKQDRTPLIDFPGVAFTWSFAPAAEHGMKPYISLGAEMMFVESARTFDFDSANFECFECEPGLLDMRVPALVPGLGFSIVGSARLGVVGDFRMHIPLGAGRETWSSGDLWPELALGALYRFD